MGAGAGAGAEVGVEMGRRRGWEGHLRERQYDMETKNIIIDSEDSMLPPQRSSCSSTTTFLVIPLISKPETVQLTSSFQNGS